MVLIAICRRQELRILPAEEHPQRAEAICFIPDCPRRLAFQRPLLDYGLPGLDILVNERVYPRLRGLRH